MKPGRRCSSTFCGTANRLLLCFLGVLAIGKESLTPGGTFICNLANGPAFGGVCIPAAKPGLLGECEPSKPPPDPEAGEGEAVPLPLLSGDMALRRGEVVETESGWALRPFVGVAFCKQRHKVASTSVQVGFLAEKIVSRGHSRRRR